MAGFGASGCGASWSLRQSCGLSCNWKKIASPSAALSNGEDEILVTLKGHNSYSGVSGQ